MLITSNIHNSSGMLTRYFSGLSFLTAEILHDYDDILERTDEYLTIPLLPLRVSASVLDWLILYSPGNKHPSMQLLVSFYIWWTRNTFAIRSIATCVAVKYH